MPSRIHNGGADGDGHGSREARIDLHAGPASGDIGFSTELNDSRNIDTFPDDYFSGASDAPPNVHRYRISKRRRWLQQLWQQRSGH